MLPAEPLGRGQVIFIRHSLRLESYQAAGSTPLLGRRGRFFLKSTESVRSVLKWDLDSLAALAVGFKDTENHFEDDSSILLVA